MNVSKAPVDLVVDRHETAPLALRGSDAIVRFTSRLAAWGLLTGVGSILISAVLGPSSLLMFTGGVGVILGGVGAATLSASALLRADVRLTWNIGGALGVPFGASLTVVGLWAFLGTSSAVFAPPGIVAIAGTVVVVLGIVLSVLLGADILRFVLNAVVDEPEP